MTIAMLEVTCRDTIVSRDGRSFGIHQGNGMRSAGWPLPSVVAGSLRAALGKLAGRELSEVTAKELRNVEVAGGFPMTVDQGKPYLPAPDDCVVDEQGKRLHAARPFQADRGGCDFPARGLRPVMLSADDATDDFQPGDCKPGERPAWWPIDTYVQWLTGGSVALDRTFLKAPLTEERTHLPLKPETGAAAEGTRFTAAALPLSHLPRWGARPTDRLDYRFAPIRLAVQVMADNWMGDAVIRLNQLYPLGGERRLAHWKKVASGPWTCPEAVSTALTRSSRARMVLASPAIFAHGWRPGWLNDQLTGSPWKDAPELRLVGVCIQRWRAVSGWSSIALPNQPRGPKPVKRMVPAGGVYFFEVIGSSAASLARGWLQPVSDDEQDRRDGFGLAAWGTW